MRREANRRRFPGLVGLGVIALVLWLAGPLGAQRGRIANSVHNLSVGGPGRVRAAVDVGGRICVFCHTSHRVAPTKPLWNRLSSRTNYKIYNSSTLDAKPGQPTGSSKLCLSCHDGTLALGAFTSGVRSGRRATGRQLPRGRSRLGTDLSDDHPISFAYSARLATADAQLVSPRGLPSEVRLDSHQNLQCTTCHSVHDNTHGGFLVMDNRGGRLCITCHRLRGWETGAHSSSSASVPPTGRWAYTTLVENACGSCHSVHSAGGRERLMRHAREENNCLPCHNGRTAGANILAELNKSSAHDPRRYEGIHDPVETLPGRNPHVECTDCHNPHAAQATRRTSGYIPIGPTLTRAPGVNIGGATIESAQYEYEVCLRCHGDSAVPIRGRVFRQVDNPNIRLEIDPGNPSYHPLVVPAAGAESVSLMPDVPRGSLIRCTDCHNNDKGPRAGGSGADGPHGSAYRFLLERRYSVMDGSNESASVYALCYKCHRRSSILNNDSFAFHSLHVRRQNTPCSVCHDPHGVASGRGGGVGGDHTHLINFDANVVFPEPTTRKLEFRDLGRFAGSCTLTCHGSNHLDAKYGK